MLIDYKNVNIYVQGGVPVLQNVNFHVDEGEFIYLIGKVGSGKSSLLKSFYFENDVEEADTAMVLGNDIRTLKRRHIPALRRQMGIIFQDFQLLGDRTVYKNLRFVLKATGWKKNQDIDKRIDDVLEAVGMLDRKDRLPHELSGGEQQRIATANAIIELLRDISQKGTAVVMSTHNIPLLDKYPGIVYRCKDSQITEVTNDYNKMSLVEDDEDPVENKNVEYTTREEL